MYYWVDIASQLQLAHDYLIHLMDTRAPRLENVMKITKVSWNVFMLFGLITIAECENDINNNDGRQQLIRKLSFCICTNVVHCTFIIYRLYNTGFTRNISFIVAVELINVIISKLYCILKVEVWNVK